jgi:hypothetical protein
MQASPQVPKLGIQAASCDVPPNLSSVTPKRSVLTPERLVSRLPFNRGRIGDVDEVFSVYQRPMKCGGGIRLMQHKRILFGITVCGERPEMLAIVGDQGAKFRPFNHTRIVDRATGL